MQAGKSNEAEEILDMTFPSSDETTEGMHPGKKPFYQGL
jgi:hypothetical protein